VVSSHIRDPLGCREIIQGTQAEEVWVSELNLAQLHVDMVHS